MKIRDIVARWPGITHDQTIFSSSKLQNRFERKEFDNSVLLGDSGHALKSYVITPITNPHREAENRFNESQIRTRNPIERLFGVLKRRFSVLSLGVIVSLDTTKSVIIACAVLHNIAQSMNEPNPIPDPNFDVEAEEMPEESNSTSNSTINAISSNYREHSVLYFMNLIEHQGESSLNM